MKTCVDPCIHSDGFEARPGYNGTISMMHKAFGLFDDGRDNEEVANLVGRSVATVVKYRRTWKYEKKLLG